MHRRDLLLLSASSLLAASAAGRGLAAVTPPEAKDAKLEAVAKATADCRRAGEACRAHCEQAIAAGDKSLQACFDAVRDMLAATTAMNDVASRGPAKRARKLAAACADLCRACAEACRPHAEHHAVCKECLATCERCSKACDDLARG